MEPSVVILSSRSKPVIKHIALHQEEASMLKAESREKEKAIGTKGVPLTAGIWCQSSVLCHSLRNKIKG